MPPIPLPLPLPLPLLLLLLLTLAGAGVQAGLPLPAGRESTGTRPLADILQTSDRLLQSVLTKDEQEDQKEAKAPLPEWLSKRQHPGKKYLSDLEKRQHPGKRDVEGDVFYGDMQKRQHPGKRDREEDLELKKRQHPGRRYLMYKRQQPSERGWGDEVEPSDRQGQKRQHPGKRLWNSGSPDATGPCDLQEPFTCNRGSLLLDLVQNVSKDRVEKKRQHPGKRSEWESQTEE